MVSIFEAIQLEMTHLTDDDYDLRFIYYGFDLYASYTSPQMNCCMANSYTQIKVNSFDTFATGETTTFTLNYISFVRTNAICTFF